MGGSSWWKWGEGGGFQTTLEWLRPPPPHPGKNDKKYYKNLKNTKNPDLYKWRPVTFVKTDKNG